jgi:hypothetical protein
MPDISMCSGIGCQQREKCYRHTAKPNEFRQSYFTNPPLQKDTQECDYFWNNEEQLTKKEE